MRSELRIKPFLSRLDVPELIRSMYPDMADTSEMVDRTMSTIDSKDFVRYWEENPDLRFGQLMFNLGLEFFDPVYHKEESQILFQCGYPISKCIQWTSLLDKDKNMLDKPVNRFIDELDTDHLLTMVEEHNTGKRYYNEAIIQIFLDELESRNK
jgi:hypothetical protein